MAISETGLTFIESGEEQSSTGEFMEKYAALVEGSNTWEFGGANGSLEQDSFMFVALSKGAVPLINADSFGDIAEHVDVLSSGEEALKCYSLKYQGDSAGLEMFVDILCDQLDFGTEHDGGSVISKMGGPLLMLAAFVGSAE